MHSLAHLNQQSVKVDAAKRKVHEIQIRLNQLMVNLESTFPNAGYVQHVCYDIGSLQRELSEQLRLLADGGKINARY